ncbi:MAG: hypothetical protein Q8N34_03780 [Gammaproteobacteria bacterium]|nr:hypothetical protein [Gammaproteobacteria bacterium]
MRLYRLTLLHALTSTLAMLSDCYHSLEAICARIIDSAPVLASAAVERIVATARSLTTTVTEGSPKPAARSGNSARSHVSLLTAINGHAAAA